MVMNKNPFGVSWGLMIKAMTILPLIICCVLIIVVLTNRSVEASIDFDWRAYPARSGVCNGDGLQV